MGLLFRDFVAIWPFLAAGLGLLAVNWARRSPSPATWQLLFFTIMAGLGVEVLRGVGVGSCDWSHGGLCLGVTIIGGIVGPIRQ